MSRHIWKYALWLVETWNPDVSVKNTEKRSVWFEEAKYAKQKEDKENKLF